MVTKNTSEECTKGHKGDMKPTTPEKRYWRCNECQRIRLRELTRQRQEQGLTAKGKAREYVPAKQEKFEAVVTITDTDECIPWPKWRGTSGYGSLYYKRRYYPVHRAVYEFYVGEIPEGYVVDHTCHNDTDCNLGVECPHRMCVNPKHLEAITPGENTRRGNSMSAVQARRTSCAKGHEYVGDNFYIRPYKNGTRRICRICERVASRRLYWRNKEKSAE